jgi:hypothetical protein
VIPNRKIQKRGTVSPHEPLEKILDPVVEQGDEELSDTPAASITRRGKVANDLKCFPIYFLLRNVAMRHAHVCQLFSQKLDGNVIEQLVEEAVTETLLAQRKHWRTETVKQHVRRALDRIVYRWKKREHVVETDDPDAPNNHESICDPRDYECEIVEKVDREIERTILQKKLTALLSPAEWRFLQQHLSRDGHDPPATGAGRIRWMRLKRRLYAHLLAGFEAGRFNALLGIDRIPRKKSSFSQPNPVTV